MRRVVPHLFTIIAALSLLLCFAAAVRSISKLDTLEYKSPSGWMAILISKSGRVDLLYLSSWPTDEAGFRHFMELAPFALRGPDYAKKMQRERKMQRGRG